MRLLPLVLLLAACEAAVPWHHAKTCRAQFVFPEITETACYLSWAGDRPEVGTWLVVNERPLGLYVGAEWNTYLDMSWRDRSCLAWRGHWGFTSAPYLSPDRFNFWIRAACHDESIITSLYFDVYASGAL